MKLGFYNFYRENNQNRMFQNADVGIGDDMSYPSIYMAKYFKERGLGLATIDTEPLENFDAVVFLDYPTKLNSYFRQLLKRRNIPLYLVVIESKSVRPDNWNRRNHEPFRKVFVWDPAWVDGKKYFQMRPPYRLPDFSPYEPSKADKFCCLISSQKYSWVKEELYSERVRAIRWFEQNHPGEFDLYGQRWDRFYLRGKLSILNPVLARLYKKFPNLPRHRNFPSARGSIGSKRDVMRQYKFSIAYENASYRGWITEKMLDAMFAGTVPVYLGDPEVEKAIPPEVFIDKRKFPDYAGLYRYMKEMPVEEYEGYRKAIHKFIHGGGVNPWGAAAYTEMVMREIVNPLQHK